MASRSSLRNTRGRGSASSNWVPDSLLEAFARFLKRLQGALIFAVAVVYAMALISYSSLDPSLNTIGPQDEPSNWLGLAGSYGADIALQFFGSPAYFLALVLAAWGWRIATLKPLDLLAGRTAAGFVALLALGTALAVLLPHFPSWHDALSSGAIGKVVGDSLHSLLPGLGGGILIAAVMVFVGVTTLYMACALTLDEWHHLVSVLHGILQSLVAAVIHFGKAVWRLVPRRESNGFDDDEDDLDRQEPEEADDEDPEEDPDEDVPEDDEEDEAPPRKGLAKLLVQKPPQAHKQSRLSLRSEDDYPLPPLDLLQWPEQARKSLLDFSQDALEKNAKLLESVLSDFGVYGQITKVSPGPVVTLYELEPSPGTRASRVISLADDIARNMSATSVRVAVVPGRNVIGIELPNKKRETVYLRELLSTDSYNDHPGALPIILGKDIAGTPIIADLARMPHLLIAGTTGSGKSVAVNTMILSLIYRLPPQKCRFIMVDPKMLELSVYEGIPHLLAPVVTDPKKAVVALKWTVREMEERYRAMSKLGVRNIEGYNLRLREAAKNDEELTRSVQTGFDRDTGKPIYEDQPLDLTPLPYIVVIVDEMADLMIVAGKEIESAIQRLAQMARAAGIHIMMATQRPSVDVITGTIKANFPTRISFQVTSKIDSRTILGEQGAEQLLGQGDMLYMAGGGRVTRVHGPFVRDDEVEAIVKFLKAQGEPEYLDEVTEDNEEMAFSEDGGSSGGSGGNDLYDKAVDIVLRERKASTSFIQRHLSIGYNRAATLIERMEREGVISAANHVGKREVFGRKPDDD